ncbi:1-aminocyclopropane-1-carboxylate deaminase/D-cysteine desulfhydrase [Campylobacter vulpis]|nr:1-aminocyclopropane-1-carboxylate deaminase/D-cysteine desulfhydrase [Campylobacter vulpis]MBS4275088.1 1-aminocyclopropane-1-carboxylate deaminase/D-cysteine desulfhydrase [Campylobacter vulpis]MBS4306663.1 1-aminocyclopropane-1-carboxylate deaminase/D-cysteine desulfhydrase [Campylobacter vulpis]MBS4329455.1 1-aminocyclopropane-1-carboxylate deaminase/D-cysteine desulfhydrase [Campylobacter vulpis]MBS4406884.1 1-aminocyclopropane-1-carboxylate deaminase/D-cysteine desulfhydrase [Campylobac
MLEKRRFKDLEFYLKRDDLLGELNGNKARKLRFYLKQNYPQNQRFVSYGGSQSNALAALSIFAKNHKLIFVCEKISNFLKQNPCGNYALALQNEVEILENLHFQNHREMALSLCKKGDIFIEEGIANQNAEFGYKELAKELKEHSKEQGVKFDIFLPSGTGTSAAFLAKHSEFRVFTCACVGGSAYLKEQILRLEPLYDFSNLFILEPLKKYHFAKPYAEFYTLYHTLKQECGVEFDLLYDMLGFSTLMLHKNKLKNPLYIHQGGLLGNETMLQRYAFKGFSLPYQNKKSPR